MKDKAKIDPKEAEKQRQMAEAVRLLGAKRPELVRQYQHIFLKNANGKVVLRDILHDTKVFTAVLKEEDLPLRNLGMKLLLTIAGAHASPQTLESLFATFIDALAEYERNTTPLD